MCAFPKCGLEFKPSTGITTHHKSFHGGDFKQWAQMCLFILWPYLDVPKQRLWFALSKVLKINEMHIINFNSVMLQVFHIKYCIPFSPKKHSKRVDSVHKLIEAARAVSLTLLNKVNSTFYFIFPRACINLDQLVPTTQNGKYLIIVTFWSSFLRTCKVWIIQWYVHVRCELFNGMMREHNLHTNHQAARALSIVPLIHCLYIQQLLHLLIQLLFAGGARRL